MEECRPSEVMVDLVCKVEKGLTKVQRTCFGQRKSRCKGAGGQGAGKNHKCLVWVGRDVVWRSTVE